jgi:hypothetical protein
VFDDYVYVATTTGQVYKYDSDNTVQSVCEVGASVELPLLVEDTVLYVTPKSGKAFAIRTSNMDTLWMCTYSKENTGPAFKQSGVAGLYVASEDSVRKIVNGAVLWSRGVSDTVASGPVTIGDGVLYFGMDGGRYYAIDDGTQLDKTDWPYITASGNANAGPWIDPGGTYVIFGTSGSNLDAFLTP